MAKAVQSEAPPKDTVPSSNGSNNSLSGNGIASANAAAVDVITRSSCAYMNAMAALNEEMFKFINNRLEKDVKLSQSLAGCHSLSRALSLQQEWMRDTSDDYVNESSKLLHLASDLANESWNPFYNEAAEALAKMEAEDRSSR